MFSLQAALQTTQVGSQDATFLLSEDLVLVEQRVEPAKKAAQIIYKKLCGCLQGQQGLEAERRMVISHV
ncbi:SH3 domain-binding protein 1-like isoform X1 [Arapaima gigas]